MEFALIIAVVKTWLHRRIQSNPYAYRPKHRGTERAKWSVYAERYYHGGIQTHRAWTDLGTSVWDLVSPAVARRYTKSLAVV